jgi:hypothetical protein
MTAKIFQYYLTELVRKLGAKNCKIYYFHQCAAHLKNTTLFGNIRVLFLPANYTTQPLPLYLGIIRTFKCHYRKQLILKTVAMIDEGLLQDAAQMKLDVLSGNAVKNRNLESDKTHHNQKLLCEGWFLDHVSSNDDSTVNLSEVEEEDWHSLQSLGVQSDVTTQHVIVLSRSLESGVSTRC